MKYIKLSLLMLIVSTCLYGNRKETLRELYAQKLHLCRQLKFDPLGKVYDTEYLQILKRVDVAIDKLKKEGDSISIEQINRLLQDLNLR